jgi:Invasion associated locus B (IalB) protein
MHVTGRPILALLSILLAFPHSFPAGAQAKRAPARVAPAASDKPRQIGKFEDWTAATYDEAGQTVCYAFARAANSTPILPGRQQSVVLTVTQRPNSRDSVALSAGFRYAQGAEVTVQVEQVARSFYTSGQSAFAREGAAAVSAFARGRQVVARSPGPRGIQVVDTFSLRGFSQAYQAINKACSR